MKFVQQIFVVPYYYKVCLHSLTAYLNNYLPNVNYTLYSYSWMVNILFLQLFSNINKCHWPTHYILYYIHIK